MNTVAPTTRTPLWIARLICLALLLPGCKPASEEAASTPAGMPAAAGENAAALVSWNDTPAKERIMAFVKTVTTEGDPGFVPPAERIAVFDNDGTLWSEQPLYFQVAFALDRVRELSAAHPEWKATEPFKSAIAGDMKGLMAGGEAGLMKLLAAAHSNVTAGEFAQAARNWVRDARHPTRDVAYTQLVFQPMLELLDYLRAHGFKTYIVSGGGVDFMRVFAEEVYGVPPEQVVGSMGDAEFQMRAGIPTLVKTSKLVFVDDKAGKPIGIHRHIGRRPIFAAGNSDGDLQMLQYTSIARDAADTRARFAMFVHHTDASREYAYDRDSHIGRLDAGLDEAARRGWLVVDMAKDWNAVYPAAR